MKKQGYILNRYLAMKNLSPQLLTTTPPFPKVIMLELTNACNHACIFCANSKMTRKKTLMNEGFTKSILSQARNLGATEVGFYTTGEPFAHPLFVDYIKEAKELGYSYTYISTNGGLPKKEEIKAALDAGLDSIKFSINAFDRESYYKVHGRDDWERVIDNLKFVSNYKREVNPDIVLSISYVVIDANRSGMDDFKEYFMSFVDDIYFVEGGHQFGNMMENLDSLLSQPIADTEGVCNMPFNRIHISAEGYLTMCCTDYQNYLALLDLNKVSLKEAWNHKLFMEMRDKHLKDELEGTLCYNCRKNVNEPIAPLVPEFSSDMDFQETSESQVEKQKERLRE